MRFPLLILCAVGCGAATPPNGEPAHAKHTDWIAVTVAWSYGPCPDDGRSCFQEVRITPDGHVVSKETPNHAGGGPSVTPLVKEATLSDDEHKRLRHLIASSEFQRGMKSGFSCETPNYDARTVITLTRAGGDVWREVTSCVMGSGAENPPKTLAGIVEPYRFVSHAAPPAPSVAGVKCAECVAVQFPEFDKTCKADDDCVVREHQSRRLMDTSVMGINRSEAARFDAAEQACITAMGPNCPSPVVNAVTAEDGQVVATGEVVVACVAGKCRTSKRKR